MKLPKNNETIIGKYIRFSGLDFFVLLSFRAPNDFSESLDIYLVLTTKEGILCCIRVAYEILFDDISLYGIPYKSKNMKSDRINIISTDIPNFIDNLDVRELKKRALDFSTQAIKSKSSGRIRNIYGEVSCGNFNKVPQYKNLIREQLRIYCNPEKFIENVWKGF